MPHPIGFTDVERDIITAAALPLYPAHRAAFVEEVVKTLAPHSIIGSGLVHRTCRELQRRFMDMPWSPAAPPPRKRGNLSRAYRG